MLKTCRCWLVSGLRGTARIHDAHSQTDLPLRPQRSSARRSSVGPSMRARRSVLDALQDNPQETALEASGRAGRDAAHAATPSALSPASPYLMPSSFEGAFQRHRLHSNEWRAPHASSVNRTEPPAADKSLSSSDGGSSLAAMKAQQSSLRAAYDYADRHHRIRLRKERAVYAEEVRAFRAAHNGRVPSRAEVSPFTDVSLPPVAALNALAYLDPRTSTMYKEVQDSLLLQQTITKSELLKSNERTLVRCLSCFHVYGARPRQLWGSEDLTAHGGSGEQSWIALENEKKRVAQAQQLSKNPKLRKHVYSVGRRRQQESSSPVRCPKCGSPRAQWAMEYVHYRTHAK